MTCSTWGISRPRAATSVAMSTPLGDDLNLSLVSLPFEMGGWQRTCRDSSTAAFVAAGSGAGKQAFVESRTEG